MIGAGDLKLMAAGAIFLGSQDAWKALAFAIFLSVPILSAYLWSRGLGRKAPAPFGPALALGLMLVGWNQLGHGELNSIFYRVGLPMLGTY